MSVDWRELPSLAALRAFDATARHGGFSGAARALNVTHAAIAQQVRALEADLKVKLAVRDGRSIQLTDAGRSLAMGLGQGFSTIAETLADLRAKENRRGIRVTTTTFVTEAVIMPRLSEFWEQHPDVEISLHPSRSYIDIEREGFDFALRAVFEGAPRSWPGMEAIHLSETRMVAAGAPRLIGTSPTDAHKYPWLWHDSNDSKRALMEQAGLDLSRLNLVQIGGPSLQLEAARQGIGITLFNERVARDDLATGRLVEVPLPATPRADYFIVVPSGPRRAIVQAFIDWLHTLF
ncbi:MAG: LysR substrate-binding domain-containing protein [Pseudomonadota bacterium]